MPGKAREIPWCTIILVASAITMHSLVLMGNLNTGAMFNKLGHSTKGWSHVGQHLGHSLNHELDVIMGNVSTRLTGVISNLMGIKAGIDNGLALIGGATDETLAQVKGKTAVLTFKKIAIAAAAKPNWPGPKGRPASVAITAKGDSAAAMPMAAPNPNALNGDDPVFMMETYRVNPARLSQLDKQTPKTYGDNEKALEDIKDAIVDGFTKLNITDITDNLGKPWPAGKSTPFEKIEYPLDTKEALATDVEIIEWCTKNPVLVTPALNAYLKDHYDEANALWQEAAHEATEWAVDNIDRLITKLMAVVNQKVHEFLEQIKPALVQIGEWLQSFGTKVQTTIEGFSTTLDKVQKIFDQLMSQMAESGAGADLMLHDTFTLFDTSHTGAISAEDLQEVGEVYGITGLTGGKGEGFIAKYDQDKSGDLNPDEFALFTEDPDIPGSMGVVLRAYAKKLAQISGNVAAARKRDEVASAVVAYLELVCAKNMTKVGWVSDRLTNGSIPMAFTADLLKNMAMNVDNPAKLFKVEPGPILIGAMMELQPKYVTDALSMMSDPAFWISEGFDPKDQPKCVERVTKWVTDAAADSESATAHAELYQLFGLVHTKSNISADRDAKMHAAVLEAMPAMAKQLVSERSQRHMAKQRVLRAQAHAKLFTSRSSKVLFMELFGGSTCGSTVEDPEATQALNAGVDAVPETLEFARFLGYNSSDTAKRFQKQCSEYMGDSSSALDAFATQIQAMIKKTQSFLNMMMDYSTPSGIDRLEDMMMDFVENAETKVKKVVMDKVYTAQDYVDSHFNLPHAIGLSTSQAVISKRDPGDIFMKVKKIMDQLSSALPKVIADVKFAKKEVSAVSKQLHSIFNTMEGTAPPIFYKVSELYSTIWIAYYILFATLTAGVLVYGFWATGWFGVPVENGEGYQAPTGFMGRIKMCCNACSTCAKGCHDNTMCFWSCIIVCEVIVLLLFIVAIVLTLVSGIKAFLGAGCSSIYFLADPKICHGILNMVQGWLKTFWSDAANGLGGLCESESLLTCQLIEEKLMKSVMYTTVGSMLAAVLSFQMIVNTAQLHEQSKWVRVVEDMTKDS